MRKISEVLRLHFKLNLSTRQSASATNNSRGSVSNYCARFRELSISIDDFLSLNEIVQKTGTFEHSFRKHLNSVYTFI